ncbi:hypothetical protein BD779DRAFT_513708 [Infundibulicybe gibba]|nr:hypothetical protein BD779DRAFT_513708 [Infundibulicybe gibba]
MDSLPDDVLLSMIRYLLIPDILNFRQTCKQFYSVTHLRNVWHSVLCDCFLDQGIPVPGLAQRCLDDSLTAQDFERFVSKAFRLHRSWNSAAPSPARTLRAQASHGQLGIIALHFLPGRGHKWLMSLAGDEGVPDRTLQCWDIETSPPVCVASREFPGVVSFAFNTELSETAVIAIQSHRTHILTIDFHNTDPASAFTTTSTLSTETEGINSLTGSNLITYGGDQRLYLWDLENSQSKVELRMPSDRPPETPYKTTVYKDFAVVFKPGTLDIYHIKSPRDSIIYPITSHGWPWKAFSLSFSFQAPRRFAQLNDYPPINILVRFGSHFPWPINLLHQYVLQPNPLHGESSSNIGISAYSTSPQLIRTMASPMRLFSKSHTAVGSRGTAVWIDSHTEDYFAGSGQGQRLAGSPLSMDLAKNLELEIESVAASAVYDYQEEEGWVHVSVDDEEGRIAIGCDDGKIIIFDYA